MDLGLFLSISLKVAGGLGLFLLGMKNMSEGMQAVAGSRLRRLINAVTNNRFVACLVGALVTCTIQSSSVTTVMLVGFVNAGLMTLTQAVGVILGADIGTTITAWFFVLPVAKAGLPMLGIAAFFYLFSKHERRQFTAMAIMGLGMVFFGLELMKDGFLPLRDMPAFTDWLSRFAPDTTLGVIKCALAGAVVTAVVQSSSATVVITMGLATTGVIEFRTAAALVLGQNIGTTITAYLASIGTSRNAQRAAYGHILMKIIAVLITIPLFPWYIKLVEWIVHVDPDLTSTVLKDGVAVTVYPHIGRAIATSHTVFNLALTALFLPCLGPFVRLLERLAPDREEETSPHLTYLAVNMLATPGLAIEQAIKETLAMGRTVEGMLGALRTITEADEAADSDLHRDLFREEEHLDRIQREIVLFLSRLLSGNVSSDVTENARAQLRMADEYETLSDYVVSLLKMHRKLTTQNIHVSDDGRRDLLELHDQVAKYVKFVNDAVEARNTDILEQAHAEATYIDKMMKAHRRSHMTRFQDQESHPLSELVFPDMLNAYRRMKDHALNIAEALAGEK